MPIDYQLSKVYTIRSPSTDKFYLGTTVKTLSGRFSGHKSNYKFFLQGKYKCNVSSYEIIKLGDAYIELLESYPCNSKEELLKREGELLRLHKDNIVNKRRENITNDERKQKMLEYKEKNYKELQIKSKIKRDSKKNHSSSSSNDESK